MLTKQEALEQIKKLQEYIEQQEKESIVPNEWEIFSDGYYTTKEGKISEMTWCKGSKDICNIDIRPTKELAEACLAMSQLSQLRNETWRRDNNWEPNWEDNHNPNYCIIVYSNNIFVQSCCKRNKFLAFRTAEIRDQFLEKHRALIEIAKPLL